MRCRETISEYAATALRFETHQLALDLDASSSTPGAADAALRSAKSALILLQRLADYSDRYSADLK